MMISTFLLSFTSVVAATAAEGLGDRLLRAYTIYDEMPLSVEGAVEAGFLEAGPCDPARGTPYTQSGDFVSKTSPSVLFYTCAGQISGVGVSVYGELQQELIDRGLFEPMGMDHHMISVTFRAGDLCSGDCGSDDAAPVGRQLLLNNHLVESPESRVLSLPLNQTQAEGQGWVRGSCFNGMGNHYFKDLEFSGKMSWVASSMLPVVVMYNLVGQIHSLFFTTTIKQQGPVQANEWEPVALETANMCKNWCDDENCGWADTDVWSTQHYFFNDVEAAPVICPASLDCFLPGIGCCPA